MKLTEKELNEFPIGTKITYYSNCIRIKVANTRGEQVWLDLTEHIVDRTKKIRDMEAKKVEIPTYTEYIPPKPILDDKEKEYLSAVIRPWKEYVTSIMKRRFETEVDSDEYISIFVSRGYNMDLPFFDAGTMYKGMKLDKEYTLEELGL